MLRFKKRTKVLNERSIPLGVLIFLEISAIVVGVMLGFTVNEWRENRNNRKIAENVLQTIAAEMSYNHNQIVNSFNCTVGRYWKITVTQCRWTREFYWMR